MDSRWIPGWLFPRTNSFLNLTQEECKKIAEGMRPQVTKQIASFIESLNELDP